MARKNKLNPWWVTQIRELVQDPDYIKRRYLHYRILALHCAEDFYTYASKKDRRVLAFKYWKIYSKRADWYYRKIDKTKFLIGR